jgi:hypothetical protein
VAHHVADGVAESGQAKRLADDEGVHRDREDQRVLRDCSSISSNWSITISANCRPRTRRLF